MNFNIPTILTFLRIAVIPIFVLLFYLPHNWAAWLCSIIFGMAAATDWFDGFLARKLRQTTSFGAFLDPVADKLIVVVALVLLTEYYHHWWVTIPVITIIAREITIVSLREWMCKIHPSKFLEVSYIAKFKTVCQLIAILVLLLRQKWCYYIGIAMLVIATLMTIYSMLCYFMEVYYHFKKNDKMF